MADSDVREVLTWETFGSASRELAQMVADSRFQADLILSIARGGLFAAGAVAYALGIKNLHVMNVEFYTDVEARLPMPVMLPPVPRQIDLSEKKVLVVDDVADTGGTLALVRNFCAPHVQEIRTAVIYEKPHSIVACDYVWRRTDKWINFPWSTLPPLVTGVQAQ
ncbi:MAG: phosphoribosyltransferase [Actinobacteria bacterium]|nr:phosphoribosyltransferase [Actinomycetota bacterium]